MKFIISVPSGYHARELLIPLRELLAADQGIGDVNVLSPVPANRLNDTFSGYPAKFKFFTYPDSTDQYRRLISALSPDLVITDTNGLDEHDSPLIEATHQVRLPVVTFIASWDNIWKIAKWLSRGIKPSNPDYFIVWNQPMKKHLLSLFPAFPAERIAVIGPPRFDFFKHHNQIPSRDELFRYLGFPDSSVKLIHLATTELYPMAYVAKAISQAARQNLFPAPIKLFASVHPGGNLGRHLSLASRYGALVRYSFGRRAEAPIPQFLYHPTLVEIYYHVALFKHADLLINHSSTVTLESLAGDTPVINVKYGRPFDLIRWRRSVVFRDFTEHFQDILVDRPTKVVTSRSQLIGAVAEYLAHPEHERLQRRTNLKKMISITNGTIGQQFIAHLKQLALSRGHL